MSFIAEKHEKMKLRESSLPV